MDHLFQKIDALLNWATQPQWLFAFSIGLLLVLMHFAHVWTKPRVAGLMGLVLVLLGVYSWFDWPGVSHAQFRESVTKPDNIPIVLVLGSLAFFTWLSFRKAVINDQRIQAGQPPVEAAEKSRKVLVWPDLVYTELIAMVVVVVVLILWSILIKAPIEEPANLARTPNPSKAPWYFLGLQELLVYFDPWLAGVLVPALIIVGLIVIPYVDRNPKGNGYYTLAERKGAIFVFLFGFLILWTLGCFIGTFLRGPGWNFFGIYEPWDVNKVEPLLNINVSEIVWVKLLEKPLPSWWLPREIFGILIVLGYFTLMPAIFARTVGQKMFRELGAIRFGIVVNLGLIMLAVPLTRPPCGKTSAPRIPLARATAKRSLSGFTATHASTSGWNWPTSVRSSVARTCCTSIRPIVVALEMKPGQR